MALVLVDSLFIGNASLSPSLKQVMHLWQKGDSVLVSVSGGGTAWQRAVPDPHALDWRVTDRGEAVAVCQDRLVLYDTANTSVFRYPVKGIPTVKDSILGLVIKPEHMRSALVFYTLHGDSVGELSASPPWDWDEGVMAGGGYHYWEFKRKDGSSTGTFWDAIYIEGRFQPELGFRAMEVIPPDRLVTMSKDFVWSRRQIVDTTRELMEELEASTWHRQLPASLCRMSYQGGVLFVMGTDSLGVAHLWALDPDDGEELLHESYEKEGAKVFVSAVFYDEDTLRVLVSGTLYTYEVGK